MLADGYLDLSKETYTYVNMKNNLHYNPAPLTPKAGMLAIGPQISFNCSRILTK